MSLDQIQANGSNLLITQHSFELLSRMLITAVSNRVKSSLLSPVSGRIKISREKDKIEDYQ